MLWNALGVQSSVGVYCIPTMAGEGMGMERVCGPRDLSVTHSGIPAADPGGPPLGLALFGGAAQKGLNVQSEFCLNVASFFCFKVLSFSLEKDLLRNSNCKYSFHELPLLEQLLWLH